MEEAIFITKTPIISHQDCFFSFCGYSKTYPKHGFGPAVRSEYVVHIVLSGKGSYTIGNQVYQLRQGQGFVVPPGETTIYQADEDDPWSYIWIGLAGSSISSYLAEAGLKPGSWSFDVQNVHEFKALIFEAFAYKEATIKNELALQKQAYRFLELLLILSQHHSHDIASSQLPKLVQDTLELIREEVHEHITVSWLSKKLAVNPSYLTRLFKSHMNISIKEYINQIRMNRAADLLMTTDMTIEDIAELLGFSGSPSFSKAFKSIRGMSPSAFRLRGEGLLGDIKSKKDKN